MKPIFSKQYTNMITKHLKQDNKNVHGYLRQNIKNHASAYLMTGKELKCKEINILNSYQHQFDEGKMGLNMDVNTTKLLLKIANNLSPTDYILRPDGKHYPNMRFIGAPTIIPISTYLLNLIDIMTNPKSLNNANTASIQILNTVCKEMCDTYFIDYELLNNHNPLTLKIHWWKYTFTNWYKKCCQQMNVGLNELN